MSIARMIDEEYVQTGQVRIVAKNYPIHGAEAELAAEAALCAADQGAFWEYHARLMESLNDGNPLAEDPQALKQLAADLGLDTAAFAACLDGGTHTQEVQDDLAEAHERGVTAAPTFFVNDTKIVGAQPYAVFKEAIDSALAAQ